MPSVTSLVVARSARAVGPLALPLSALLPTTSSLIVALTFSPSFTAMRARSASPCAGDSMRMMMGAVIEPLGRLISVPLFQQAPISAVMRSLSAPASGVLPESGVTVRPAARASAPRCIPTPRAEMLISAAAPAGSSLAGSSLITTGGARRVELSRSAERRST